MMGDNTNNSSTAAQFAEFQRRPSALPNSALPSGRRHDSLDVLFELAAAYTASGHTGKAKECLDRILAVVPVIVGNAEVKA